MATTPKQRVVLDMLNNWMSLRALDMLRLEKQLVYGSSSYLSADPNTNTVVSVTATSYDPKNLAEVTATLRQLYQEARTINANNETFEKAKAQLLNTVKESFETNAYWSSYLEAEARGVEQLDQAALLAAIEAVTPDMVSELAKQVLPEAHLELNVLPKALKP